MRCPTCRRSLPDYALHCEHCAAAARPQPPAGGREAVPRVDDAVMTSAEANDLRRPSARGRVSPQGAGSARPSARAENGAPPPGGAGERALHTRVVALDREGERATRIVEVELPAIVKRSLREREGGAPADRAPAELALLGELPALIARVGRQLHPRDRTTLWALAVTFLGTFLPWYHQRVVGLLAGVEGRGLVSAILVPVAVALLLGRSLRRRWAFGLLLGQTVSIAGVVAVPVYELVRGALGAWYLGAGATMAAGVAALAFSLARLSQLGDA